MSLSAGRPSRLSLKPGSALFENLTPVRTGTVLLEQNAPRLSQVIVHVQKNGAGQVTAKSLEICKPTLKFIGDGYTNQAFKQTTELGSKRVADAMEYVNLLGAAGILFAVKQTDKLCDVRVVFGGTVRHLIMLGISCRNDTLRYDTILKYLSEDKNFGFKTLGIATLEALAGYINAAVCILDKEPKLIFFFRM